MEPLPLLLALRDWHDLFLLFGTASATLTGLLFVAASVGAGFYTPERHPALQSFLSPTLVKFTSVLMGCLVAIAPLRSWGLFGGLIGAIGLFGMVYAFTVWRRMVRHGYSTTIDLEDRLCYAALPAAGYVVMLAAGVVLAFGGLAGIDVLAVAMGMLLLVGIRNAWDMTIFVMVRQQQPR